MRQVLLPVSPVEFTLWAALAKGPVMMGATRRWSIGMVAAWAWVVGSAGAQDYPIKLERPDRVGQKIKIDLKGTQSQEQVISVAGQQAQKQLQEMHVELAGLRETLAVDERGKATEARYTVDRCIKLVGDKEEDLLKPGQVFVQQFKNGTSAVLIDGKPAGEELQAALTVVVPEMDADPTSADDLFGTTQRVKVGASWKANSEAVARSLGGVKALQVKAQDIDGAITLKGVKNVDGMECLQVVGEITIAKVGVPMPPEARVEKSRMQMRVEMLAPVDPAAAVLSAWMRMRFEVSAKITGNDGSTADMEMTVKKSLKGTMTPVK